MLLLFLTLANAFVIDYPASQMGLGWITIVLHAREPVSVASVTWCRSTVPNGATPPPPDIAECTAPNLQHLQLYPSARPYLRYPAEAEPNTLYVDADDLGGWDLRHQFDIIISGDKGAFRQVVRFNALAPAPPTTAEFTTEAQTTEAASPLTTTAQGPTAESTSAPTATSVDDPTPAPPPATVIPLPVPALPSHPWLGSALFLGAGLLCIALSALAIRWRQLRAVPPPAAAPGYEWNDLTGVPTDSEGAPLPAGAEVEMTEFSRDE